MATNINPNRDSRQLENDNFAYQGDGSDLTKVVRRVEDEEAAVLLSQILAALGGGGDTAIWTRNGPFVVTAGNTLVIDVTLLTNFSRLDYIINFKDDPTTVTKSLKLVAQNNAGTVTDSVSERLGGSIDVNVQVTDDGIDAFLEITNNEAFDVTVTFLRALTE